jgi:hypothetical protein
MRCHLELRRSLTVGIFCEAAAEIRAVQSEKQFTPMETAGDKLSLVRAEHPQKVPWPIVVTESGIVMAVREEHSLKAITPIIVTPSGIVMAVREEQ